MCIRDSDDAVAFALGSPLPTGDDLWGDVYAPGTS